MNDKQLCQLLELLWKREEACSGGLCAKTLGMSLSVVKKEIQSLNLTLRRHGCEIVGKSGRGNGYSLQVSDEARFEAYLDKLKHTRELQSQFALQENRVCYIAQRLLEADDWLKATQFQDEVGVSSAQLSRDMKRVRGCLQRYDLELQSKPHYGLRVAGTEYNIRMCLSYILKQKRKLGEGWMAEAAMDAELERIQQVVLECCDAAEFRLSNLMLENLTGYLYVACKRSRNRLDAALDPREKDALEGGQEYRIAEEIVRQISQNLRDSIQPEDVYYVAAHLRSVNVGGKANCISLTLVNKMVERIRQEYGIDLENNLDFKMMLALHVAPLMERVRYHIPLENPLLDEIKSKFLLEYDLSLCCAEVIEQECQSRLSEDEVGYVAIYIKLALNQIAQLKPKNILLVCATGRGSAQLMKYQLQQQYGAAIGQLDCCESIHLPDSDLSRYDAVFTTVPLAGTIASLNIPVFLVDSLMGRKDAESIGKFLSNGSNLGQILDCFRPELFFGVLDAADQGECIQLLCKKIREHRPLPEGFEEAVKIREQMASTNLGEGRVAFPHPCKIMTEETFISVAVLKRPIPWGEGRVQLVLLSSFEKKFIKQRQDVFKIISEIITNRKYAEMLIADPAYHTLIRIIKQIY